MDISKTIEIGENKVRFEGVLEGDELDFVLQCGLNVLFSMNMLPLMKDDVNAHVQDNEGDLH